MLGWEKLDDWTGFGREFGSALNSTVEDIEKLGGANVVHVMWCGMAATHVDGFERISGGLPPGYTAPDWLAEFLAEEPLH